MSLRKKRRISKIQEHMDKLQQELNSLMDMRFPRKRSLRAIGTTPAGARPQGQPRCRGRIFGCLPGGPGECESTCGLTDRKIDLGTTTSISRSVCYKTCAQNVAITTVTLNLAAPASVVVMAALVAWSNLERFQIQRPLGTNVTDQWTRQRFGITQDCGDREPVLHHLEACEQLAAGNYTWNLVPIVADQNVYAWWMKAREITCLPV